jgi:hypothetical protein
MPSDLEYQRKHHSTKIMQEMMKVNPDNELIEELQLSWLNLRLARIDEDKMSGSELKQF